MPAESQPDFQGFTPELLESLRVAGVNERWAAVQQHLHPAMLALADALQAEGVRRFPRAWPLYEFSFRSLRYVNKPGARAPIEDYHMALDRPPRGSGIYIVVSGAERLIVVALQIGVRQRKDDLRRIWEEGRAIWQPLIERVDDVRFAEKRRPTTDDRRPTNRSRIATNQALGGSPILNSQFSILNSETWMDRYLATRGSAY